jgi:hypothetical protein
VAFASETCGDHARKTPRGDAEESRERTDVTSGERSAAVEHIRDRRHRDTGFLRKLRLRDTPSFDQMPKHRRVRDRGHRNRLLLVQFDQVCQHIQIVLLARRQLLLGEQGIHHLNSVVQLAISPEVLERELPDELEVTVLRRPCGAGGSASCHSYFPL